ncbi:MAG: hypothetical protein J1G38_04120 [Clostridiales bacterium]|nr:hypothetical protein [Clostridiales bacterium]
MIKRIFIVILTLLIAVVFAGCGSYAPPAVGGRPPSGSGEEPPGGVDPPIVEPPVEETYTFTVKLADAPDTLPENMQAIWTKNSEVHSAKFIDGVASVEGLDGEYRVTLSNLPSGYTYDCNGYNADNIDRDVTIPLLKILSVRNYFRLQPNNEKSVISWYTISEYGTYRATIRNADEAVGYAFEPKENGRFSITSWCDATANEINPAIKIYYGTEHFCQYIETLDDGGAAGYFTKNFKYTAEFGDENIGAMQLFAVKAAVNDISYPVTVDFTIKRESEYELPPTEGEPYYAKGPYCTKHETGVWRYIYEDNTATSGSNTFYIQDQTKVMFNKADGYYHVGTADGPLLYARLTKDCQIFVTRTPGGSWVNQGFSWNEFKDGMVKLTLEDGYNYSYMINKGYEPYCDANGAHPVTEEIKTFLQGYASRENLFRDGEGHAEDPALNVDEDMNPDGIRLQSDENSMWMFACGYYK